MELKFSLESKKGLDTEISNFFRNSQLKSYHWVNGIVLRRWNKDSLADALFSVLRILERSQQILDDAALDMDNLKSDHIQNQSKLLAAQEELIKKKSVHLKEVKTTVDEKLTSCAEVVKSKHEQQQPNPLCETKLKQAVKSAIQDNDRAVNVMMFNVKEETERGISSSDFDKATAKEILSSTGVEISCEVTCERLGT